MTWPWSGPKASSRPRAQLRDDLLGGRAQARLDVARGLLQVGAQHLDARARLLAIQHAGADLDRVGDDARRVLARVDRARDELGGDGVVDDDVLDDQAADERVDAGRAERGGGLHVQGRRLRPSADVEAAQPLGLLGVDVERVDLRVPGPARVKSTSAATASGGPSKTASTDPSPQLRTQPATPRRCASRRVLSRKKTPGRGPWRGPAADG